MRAFDFPFETVEISCPTCGRFGRYSKARFCELVGPNTPLNTAIDILAQDRTEDRYSPTNTQGRCRAGYPQLLRLNATTDTAKAP